MDFLKSAVASAIAKGPPFPYTFGDKVDLDPSIWTLYKGTRREDGSNCSIFSFDITNNRPALPLARNALKKLRTLRHPGVIKVLDTVETDSYIYIATERLVPLRWHVERKSLSPETIKWGLYSIAATVKFINDEASSVHGNLKVASIYTSESGEWKLGGFEVLSSVKDDDAVIYRYGSLVPDSGRYTPPELASSGWDALRRSPHSAVDSYDFGILVFEVFNGSYLGTDQVGQTKNVPPSMHTSYKRLTNANPKARVSVAHFLEQGKRRDAFFDSPLIKLTEGVDNLGVKSEKERETFLEDLDQLTDDFPEEFFKMKVLPELLKSVEFGGGGPKAFGVVMKIGAKLDDDDFESKVTPVVVRLFSNPDRAIRVCLLDNLPLMIDRLSQKIVNDKIFPQITSGFTDLAPVVREQTLKSVLTLVTKLSDRTINGELLRHLAKTANDEQPGIRTNTTICLGKIAKHLGGPSRAKVLIAAFTRSLRDPFVHARNAALMALAVTGEFFSDEESAGRILPVVCPLLLDKEKLIRDQASKTVDIYLHKVRKAAAAMPDSALPPATAENGAAAAPRMSTPQPVDAMSTTAAWAGWAISSFTNKLSAAAGEIQSSSSPSASAPLPAPNGAAGGASKQPSLAPQMSSSSASALHRQAVRSPRLGPSSRASSTSNLAGGGEAFFQDPDPTGDNDNGGDDDGDDVGAWGDMGDMDDNDDGNNNGTQTPMSMTMSSSAVWSKEASLPARGGATVVAAGRTVSGSASASTPSAHPFGDDEPDFAGWLAAQQAQKRAGVAGGKPLPKGLAKPAAAAAAGALGGPAKKKPATAALAQKPMAATKKKIDLKPKEPADDGDDGWGGDGW